MKPSILLLYFAVFVPASALWLGGLYLLRKKLDFWPRTVLFLLFYVVARYSLRLVPSGLVPYVADTPLFYTLLTAVLVVGCWFYVTKIEGMTWKDVGWVVERPVEATLWAVGFIVLGTVLLLPLSLPLKGTSLRLSPGMLVVALTFGVVLAGFLEETIFRGVIQTKLREAWPKWPTILVQALIFSASHLFYFPFDRHAAFYLFTFVMGFAAGFLRDRFSLIPAGIMHGGLVVLTVLAPDWLFGFLSLHRATP